MCYSDDENVFVQAPPQHCQAVPGKKNSAHGVVAKQPQANNAGKPGAAPCTQAASQPLSVRSLFTRPSQLALPAVAAAQKTAGACSKAVPAAVCPAKRPTVMASITQPSQPAAPATTSQSLAGSAAPVESPQATGDCAAAPLSQLWGDRWRIAQAPPGTGTGSNADAADAVDRGAFGDGEACSQLGSQLAAATVHSAFCPACGCFLFDLAGGAAARAAHVTACPAVDRAVSNGEASDGCRSDGGDGQESDASEAAVQSAASSDAADAAERRAKRPALRELATTSVAEGCAPREPVTHLGRFAGAAGRGVIPGDASMQQGDAAGAWRMALQLSSRAAAAAGAVPRAAQARPTKPLDPAQRAGSEAGLPPCATAGRCSPSAGPAPEPSMRLWLRQRDLEAHADALERAGLTPSALPALCDQARI